MHQQVIEQRDYSQKTNDSEKRRRQYFIRSRSPDPFKNLTRGYYLRLRGIPMHSTEAEVFEFLRGVRVYKDDIAFQFDFEGKFSGEVYVKLYNEDDLRQSLSFHCSTL